MLSRLKIPLLLSLIITGSFVAGVRSNGYYQQFYDVPPHHFAASAIDFVLNRGLMRGRAPQIFDPNSGVSRGELAVIIERMYKNGDIGTRNQYYNNNNQNGYYPPYPNTYNNNQYHSINNLEARYDDERRKDIKRLANAIQKYVTDTNKFPTGIEKGNYKEICYSSSGLSCGKLVDLDILRPDYLSTIPRDPSLEQGSQATNQKSTKTGYVIKKDDNNRVYILAQLSNQIIEEIQ